MSLSSGTRIGSYEVTAQIGAGGMGEVYRARDTKLNRDVAIKVLPESVANDPERLARFHREAQVLASLNHPNIAHIHGYEESSGTHALVMELVEGPTLAEILAGSGLSALGSRPAASPKAQSLKPEAHALPLSDALNIARQLAEALEAAHEQGIIHRDLKPANIKVRDDGTVKVLDFGLAKLVDANSAVPISNVTASPTFTSPLGTMAGVILGTAAYMSPEQASGKSADKRSDIWSFGVVLFEMLTGRQLFGGGMVSHVLASVLKDEPDWAHLPRNTPAAIRTLLQRCLAKDRRRRLDSAGVVRLEIEDALNAPADLALAPPTSRSRERVAWSVAATAVAALSAVVLLVDRAPVDQPETRLQIVTPPSANPTSLAISPDGRSVVFEARSQLWLRQLGSDEALPLMGTELAQMPFWSPDSRSIAFFAAGSLKRIDLANGFVRTLARAPQPRGGSWNRDGTILFTAGSIGALFEIPVEGGTATPATTFLPGQTSHRFAQFLPDGRRFLLFTLGTADVRGIYQGSLTDPAVRRISDRESAYAFLPPDYILFARQGALWARRLNRDVQVEGEFIAVAPKILVNAAITASVALSASSSGAIAYRASAARQQLAWLDRSGRTITTVGQADDTQVSIHDLSRDGRTVAVMRAVDGNSDVWLIDAERGVARRLTVDPGTDGVPVLSPDGTRVAYVTDSKNDVYQIHERPADGTASDTVLFESEENKNPLDWSPDGRYILFASQSVSTNFDIWALPLFGDRRPIEVARTPFVENNARFSPDGKWVAYMSGESGQPEVYVQPFPGPGPKSQVSIAGGQWPRWRQDGRELVYVALDDRLMTVSMTARGSTFEASSPRALFTLPVSAPFELSPDGQRFLVMTSVSDASPITVILNWEGVAKK